MSEVTKRELHLRYWLAMLGLGLVVVLTLWIAGGGAQVQAYVTFAVTIAAGVLAVLSIIYAFVSTASLSSTLSSLQNLGTQVTEGSARLDEAREAVEEAAQRLTADLSERLRTIEAHTSLLPQVSAWFAKHETPTTTPPPPGALPGPRQPDKQARIFLSKIPVVGLLVLQAARWAKESGTKLKPDALERAGAPVKPDYVLAMLVTMAAALIVDYRGDFGEGVTVSGVHPVMISEGLGILEARTKGLDQGFVVELQAVQDRLREQFLPKAGGDPGGPGSQPGSST
jgi:hypothetical protein